MTFQIQPENLLKISGSQLETIQATLIKTGYALDEVREYDNGTTYECWSSTGNQTDIVLEVTNDETPDMERLIVEVIDCWLELRAIRELLTEGDEQPALPDINPPSPHEQLMIKVNEWEADSSEEEEVLKLIFGDNFDPTLLSFMAMGKDEREALLQ